ncbi:putative S-adenosylmethionine-dependent methyltransferase At5g38780 [Morella rubra]|uniref:Putative S-adenosylmethionine-dependent methyltransferase At5g38780 n=1 Tax=Morella rubra TaxID=262757 RepID=A0A6A1VGF8_9ROSI|nr:putative S-adenosylmethionine-dependent methyltransferase At5g38780 [Morella rubra]
MAGKSTRSSPMKGGDGQYSYAHNSSYQVLLSFVLYMNQREGLEIAKVFIKEAIVEKLGIKSSSLELFTIADLGCSVGPNTLVVVENIIDSVKHKYQSIDQKKEAVEFLVFFNDHVSNDFNTLFKSFPSDNQYFAAGVPGPFQDRLFPKASLHFVHCSYSLHWLSKVPNELMDQNSPAWNEGRIYHTNGPNAVREAYSAQFAKDIESFLNARAEELVHGGLMALIIACLPDGVSSQSSDFAFIDLLEATLKEMADEGILTEDEVDSFNFPQYNPTPAELGTLLERNCSFSIERMEPLVRPARKVSDIQSVMSMVRALWEELIEGHFGNDVLDELFDRLKNKIVECSILSQSSKKQVGEKQMVELYVLLKRKACPDSLY